MRSKFIVLGTLLLLQFLSASPVMPQAKGVDAKLLASSTMDKIDFKKIEIPVVIHDANTAQKIIDKLDFGKAKALDIKKFDFKKNVILILYRDARDPNSRSKPRPIFSKDGKWLMLGPQMSTLIGFAPSNRVKFSIYQIPKNNSIGFAKREFKGGKFELKKVLEWSK